MPPRQPTLRLEGAARRYGDTVVLGELTLDFAAGERVAVIGPSGAGKTTLLRLLGALLWPSRGRVLALGRDTSTLRGRALQELRRDIGFLHQHDNLVPGLRVVHNVLMGRLGSWSLWRSLWSLLAPRELDRARTALRAVELEHKLWAMPETLSGGEQQRVALARLALQEPRVLLADEPVSSLDIRLGREVVERLSALATGGGATLVVSLHSLDLLQGHFDRVCALREGRLFWQGPPEAITGELLREVYGAEYRALRLDELSLEGTP